MKIAIKNFDNKQVREIELPEEVFGYPYNQHLIHEAVQAYLAGLRRGTHATKTRSEVSGSGRKLWRQKGTGRARVKDVRNPKWRGGGKATHGSMFHRAPGSIGASAYPSRVMKGMRMGGRMGGARVTTKNLLIVKVDADQNLIYVRGAVPGPKSGYVAIRRAKRG